MTGFPLRAERRSTWMHKIRMHRMDGMRTALTILPILFIPVRSLGGESDTIRAAMNCVELHKDAIVQVSLVLKISTVYGGRQAHTSERKVEINGTVVDPSGLAIISNVATDPSSMYSMDMGEDAPRYRMETSVTDLKIVLADGKEYPAKIVLRDKDLDLAFVRPDEQGLTLPHIELKESPPPKLLDEIIALSRLDRSANREPSVGVARIMSIIKKPRVRYLAMSVLEPGCPVFDARGRILGLALMRTGGRRSSGGFSFMSMMPAVLPCADILEVMEQVPAATGKK